MRKVLFTSLLAACLALAPASSLSGLPPTTLKGQAGSKKTTFNFQAPHNQAVQVSGTTSLIDTGNADRLKNGSFEGGVSDWTASGGSLASETGSGNQSDGAKSASWNASATAQTLCSPSITVASGDGLSGVKALASCKLKAASGTATHQLCVSTAGNGEKCQSVVSSTSVFKPVAVPYTIPATATLTFCLKALAADEPTVYLDSCKLERADESKAGAAQAETRVGAALVPSGATSVAVAFPEAMPSNEYEVFTQFRNTVDAVPAYQATTVSAKTSTGFTAKWTTATATPNYTLAYQAVGTSGYTPLYYDDLAVWLDPSDAASIYISSGTTVAGMRDKSKNGYNFYTLSTREPAYAADYFAAGKHGVYYAGDDNLKADVTLPTYITVFMIVDTAGGELYLMNHNNGAGAISTVNPGMHVYGGDARWAVTRTGEVHVQNGGITLSGGAKIVTFVYGATEQALYLGNTLTTGGTSGSLVSNSDLLADLTLFSSSFEDRFLVGRMGEVRVYNRQLSATEHQNVRNELSAKWGVAL